ncbi:MAG: MerR family transcriptional regulator [Tissierellia bacterium]|nr:MerR family transcriptional regulator [Tissierellia bacterium]
MGRRRSDDVIANADIVTIGELVRLTGVRYSTLKHYTEENMIEYLQEEENLTRRYDRVKAMERIDKILKLRLEGLSILEIKERL